jgi:hypothetical protein
MDGCRDYNLLYLTDDSHCLVDLIGGSPQVTHESSVADSIGIQLFAKSIFKLSFLCTNIFNIGYHIKKAPLQKEKQRESAKCVVGY